MQPDVLDPLPPDVLTEPEAMPLRGADGFAQTDAPTTPAPTHSP
jgi:hypothetical protein